MAENFEDFVEKVRDANPIEEVLEESGIKLRGHGRLRTAAQHDSMKVRTDMGRVFWYSHNWNGDVFAWVMQDKGIEFNDALEILARRAHIEMPKFSQVNESEVKTRRATADVFSVAAHVFQRWLIATPLSSSTKTSPQMEEHNLGGDSEALAYARGRGWSDETIKNALVGFSGRKTAEQYKDMKGEFNLYGIALDSPAAVAVLGFEGDVEGWAMKYDLRRHEDFDAEWIVKSRIHGLMDVPGLIYAHQHKGGVTYLSRRHLPGFDKIKSDGKQREWKSFNPYKLLAGPKQAYFNHAERVDRPLICVEGQGDAVTWGQWGQGAMAFCGLLGDPERMAPEDGERLRKLAGYINKHPAVYLQLDDDDAGRKVVHWAAKLLGPRTQIVRMAQLKPREAVSNQQSAKGEDEEASDEV
jgi:DNA primase